LEADREPDFTGVAEGFEAVWTGAFTEAAEGFEAVFFCPKQNCEHVRAHTNKSR
jgi:hypothetical protein